MGMQTDVSASIPLTATGQFTDQASVNLARVRVKSVYIVPTALAGSVILRDGGSGGSIKITINTVASAIYPTFLLFPGEGILFTTNVYAALSNVGSAIVIYG